MAAFDFPPIAITFLPGEDASVPVNTHREQSRPAPRSQRCADWAKPLAGRLRNCLLAALALLCSNIALSAAESAAQSGTNITVASYLRIDESKTNIVELQVALRKLVSRTNSGTTIWLAAVTHIGDTNFFRNLQQHLSKHDVVLFEAVLPERKGGWSGPQFSKIRSALPEGEANLQTDLAHSLGLAFQLEAVNYNHPNYRNSDISVEGIQRLLNPKVQRTGQKPGKNAKHAEDEESNESFDQLMQIMEGKGFLGGLLKFGVSMIAANPRLQAVTKLTFIDVLGGLKGDIASTKAVPPDMAQLLKVLIHNRNQTVVDDLRKELLREKSPASISVFFGAGHMDDLERRVRDQLNYVPVEDVWIPAFSVDLKKSGISEWERTMIRFMTDRQLQMINPTHE